jgi:glucose-fructose oxidoreductase
MDPDLTRGRRWALAIPRRPGKTPVMPRHPSRRDFIRLVALTSAAAAGHRLLRAGEAVNPPPAAVPAPRPLGVALLGLGSYSTQQLGPALRQTRRCRLTGVITGTPAKAERWAREYRLPRKNLYDYDNLERIADNPDIDIIYVVTPPARHAEFTLRAAKAGKHVISEKPMACSVAECDAMIAACRAAGVKLSIGYRLHFDPYHQELLRLARDPACGPFHQMTGEFSFTMREKQWRVEKRMAGGGPMMDVGIYVVHGACTAAGGVAPLAVLAHEEPKTRPGFFRDVEETMRWTMIFPGGASCSAVSSYSRQANWFRAEGPNGWIDFPDNAFSYRGIHGRTSRGPLRFDPPINQQAAQMDDFSDCIVTNRESPVAGELGRRDLRILSAIYESAATGRRVTV